MAILTQTLDATQTLRQVAARVEMIPDKRMQSNVVSSIGILAGLLLKREFNQLGSTGVATQRGTLWDNPQRMEIAATSALHG